MWWYIFDVDGTCPKMSAGPVARVWLAMMHRAGLGPFSWGDGPTFDHHGNFSLRNARYHRKDDNDQMRKDDGACPTK